MNGDDAGGVKCGSAGGVKCGSVGGVKCGSGGEMPPSDGSERGSVIAVLGFVGAFIIVAALVLAGVTERVVDRSRAQAAADAAALAGVADGREAASAMATANHATLIQFEDRGNEVTVEVVTPAGTVATANAERRLETVG